MAKHLLLSLETEFLLLEIRGPLSPRQGIYLNASTPRSSINVSVDYGSFRLSWRDLRNVVHHWPEEGGPSFFEDTVYSIRAKSLLEGVAPSLHNRDPKLLQDVEVYMDERSCVGTFNFHRQIGHSILSAKVGSRSVELNIEVFPSKIDYERDYYALLLETASISHGLVLEYLRSTYRTSSVGQDDKHQTPLEWLLLLRNQIEDLASSIRYISQYPFRSLTRGLEDTRLERISLVDPSVRDAIRRRLGHGPKIDVEGIGPTSSIIPVARPYETLDTPEHQWLRQNLLFIEDRLMALRASLTAERERNTRYGSLIQARLAAEENEISGLIWTIGELLRLPLFARISNAPPVGYTSLTMLRGVGYSDAYKAIVILRQGLSIIGDPFVISVMDVNDLYEAWCFISITKLVLSRLETKVDLASVLQIDENGIRVKLRRGEHLKVICEESTRTVEVLYNPTYPGLTGHQRPDIVVRFRYQDMPDLVVVLDAKYRLDASDEYQRQFGCIGPPLEALNALHRYRDAIVVDDASHGLKRPVIKGAALYPLASSESDTYLSSRLSEALRVLGIGAIPYLPTNSQFLEQWLDYLLSIPVEELANHGPPYAGYSITGN